MLVEHEVYKEVDVLSFVLLVDIYISSIGYELMNLRLPEEVYFNYEILAELFFQIWVLAILYVFKAFCHLRHQL